MSASINNLLDLLAVHGGKIVSTAGLSTDDLEQAKASGRIVEDKKGLGYVWEPNIIDFPTTEEEVAFFERWYPLDVAIPEGLADRILESIFSEIEEKPHCPNHERHNNEIRFYGFCSGCGFKGMI